MADPALDMAAQDRPRDAAADTAVSRVVNAAYRVVEENIQEGRRAAERLRGAGAATREATPDARTLAGRLMQITRELGGAWVDLMVALVNEPDVRALIDRLSAHDRGRPGPQGGPHAGGFTAPPATSSGLSASLAQRVISRKPFELTLSSLPLLAPDAAPAVAGLHALDPTRPAISQVAAARRADGGLELTIAIADEQPPDTYWGALVDLTTNQPIGTLMLRVLE